MAANVFVSAIAYTTWADQQICQVAALLTPEQRLAPQPDGVKSVQATLAHLFGAQQVWLKRWQGTSPTHVASIEDFPTLDGLIAAWDGLHRDLAAFVAAGIDPDRLITYKNVQGTEFTFPLGMLVWHVVNHSTQHRSEAAAMCSAVGHSPGDLDITVYLRLAMLKSDV